MDLENCGLSNQDLRRFDLRSANLLNTSPKTADLRGVDLSDGQMDGASVNQARTSGAFADWPGGRRSIVWRAEPDARGGPPATLLRTQPPFIVTGDSAVRVADFEWRVPPAASRAAAR